MSTSVLYPPTPATNVDTDTYIIWRVLEDWGYHPCFSMFLINFVVQYQREVREEPTWYPYNSHLCDLAYIPTADIIQVHPRECCTKTHDGDEMNGFLIMIKSVGMAWDFMAEV